MTHSFDRAQRQQDLQERYDAGYAAGVQAERERVRGMVALKRDDLQSDCEACPDNKWIRAQRNILDRVLDLIDAPAEPGKGDSGT